MTTTSFSQVQKYTPVTELQLQNLIEELSSSPLMKLSKNEEGHSGEVTGMGADIDFEYRDSMLTITVKHAPFLHRMASFCQSVHETVTRHLAPQDLYPSAPGGVGPIAT